MYEQEKAQMAGFTSQSQTQQYPSSVFIAGPQYGGDCALKQDGLSSSAQRLHECALQLNQATWQLRAFFGMDLAEPSCATPRPAGFKGDIDEAVSVSRASLDNVNLILDHLRS